MHSPISTSSGYVPCVSIKQRLSSCRAWASVKPAWESATAGIITAATIRFFTPCANFGLGDSISGAQ